MLSLSRYTGNIAEARAVWIPCHTSADMCMLCSRVHDRTISAIRYLPEEGLVATIAFDNTLRIFNALQSTLRCTVTNDTGGPFVAMEHDAASSQVAGFEHNLSNLVAYALLQKAANSVAGALDRHTCIVPHWHPNSSTDNASDIQDNTLACLAQLLVSNPAPAITHAPTSLAIRLLFILQKVYQRDSQIRTCPQALCFSKPCHDVASRSSCNVTGLLMPLIEQLQSSTKLTCTVCHRALAG